jgi:mRNA interferase RelE/StbE
MVWKIELDPAAEKELGNLDKQVAIRILKFLNERLAKAEDPRSFGESLTGRFEEYWKYRVSDYRIICNILDGVLTW